LAWARHDKGQITKVLACVGGPLNDNVLQYSNEQLKPLQKILELSENGEYERFGASGRTQA
jgi:hypothetical protein